MSDRTVLDKAYDPKPVEDRWGAFWLENGVFTADASSSRAA